ncbi:MAG: transporter ATP-binding protein [Verrucomicrobiales bacterium]|nr:transporter ATP-binding protein [Verrucomicrobiales bacterium]
MRFSKLRFALRAPTWKDNGMNAAPILEVEQLGRSYPSAGHALTVLKEISFSVAAGSSCSIVGPSGSGKTTLLGLCAGLDQPTTGTVKIDGESLAALNEDQRAALRNRLVGFVFQNYQLLPTLTALENVMVPVELRGGRQVRSAAEELLERVGLRDRGHHYPSQLSGGEQQRVAVARAFINKPKLLFADEPTGNLDDETSSRIVDTLFNLNHHSGTTLVLVTHNLELAERTQRIIRLRGGSMISDVTRT